MRSGIVTAGIVLLIVGLAAFMTAQIKIQEFQSLLGQVAIVISNEARQNYQMFQLMQMGGAILSVIGGIVCIAGFVAKAEVWED